MLRVAAIELPARFGDVSASLAEVRTALEAGPATDLVLLPECAFTGYVDAEGTFDPTPFAEPLDGPTMSAVGELCRTFDTAIAAPLVELADGKHFNSFVVTGAKGERLHHYKKRHPWFPEAWATPGANPFGSFELAGHTIALAICFDLHFLTREAATVLTASDVLLFPSAWVDDGPRDLRGPIFANLAKRFDVTIVNANWSAGDVRVRGQGASRIVAPSGEIVRCPSRPGWSRIDARLFYA